MKIEQWLGEENKLGIDIWNKKYRYNNETFDEWLDRISNGNNSLRQLIIDKKFLFGGRILANRGLHKRGKKVTYSNCYVLPQPEDNIEGIFNTARDLARTFSFSGGCGIDISKLRPIGMKVHNAAEETSGSVSFMDLYSKVTEIIGCNGRRGALMLSIICSHPDIIEFINIKSDLDKVTKANISIRILNDFMNAVKNDLDWELYFKCKDTEEIISKKVKARELYHKICYGNWDMAEPGMLFWDRICNWNLLSEDKEFEYAGTNPCAEEPLPAGGSCLLGSLNLSEFVENPFTSEAKFNLNDFIISIEKSIIALNEVLLEGLPLHPLQIQRDTVNDWRQIGLGVFGIGDMLIKLGIRYGSKESLEFCEVVASAMSDIALNTSALIAKTQGVYPKYKKEAVMKSKYLLANASSDTYKNIEKYGLAHSQLLTIAPTGTLSTMLGVTGGIEPIFATHYTRKTESLHGEDVFYKVYTPIVEEVRKQLNIKDDNVKLPDYIITANELDYKQRIDMQSVWQLHIDASISSTVNVKENFSVEDVEDLYMYSWEKGLKGVTIYRDKCRRSGILTTGDTNKKDGQETDQKNERDLPRSTIVNCSDDLIGKKRKLITGCGSLHLQAWADPSNGNILEIYLSKGSTGGCMAYMNALSRMTSYALRGGCPIEGAIDQLESIPACPSYTTRTAVKHDTSAGSSCPHAISKALKVMQQELWDELNDDDVDEKSKKKPKVNKINRHDKINKVNENEIKSIKCPECGEELVFEGGCNSCKNCGYSKCD